MAACLLTGAAFLLPQGCTTQTTGSQPTAAATNTPQPTPTAGPSFNDDFENGGSGWGTGMNFMCGTLPNSWRLSEPTPGAGVTPQSPGPHSGLFRWGTEGNNGKHFKPEDSWLLSPPFQLPPDDPVSLTFWHWFEFVQGTDGLLIEARIYDPENPGVPLSGWVPVGPVLPCTGIMAPPTPPPGQCTPWLRNGALAYTGTCGTWQKVTLDLESFAGQLVRIRWHLGAAPGFGNRPGYYLDDVAIQ